MRVWVEELVSIGGAHIGRVFSSWEIAKRVMRLENGFTENCIHEERQKILFETRYGGIIVLPKDVIEE